MSATVPQVRETELTPRQKAGVQRATARLERDQARARERYAEALRRLVEDGASLAAIARELGVSREAVRQRVAEKEPREDPA